jgi:murein L,D-transpeptidase YafK
MMTKLFFILLLALLPMENLNLKNEDFKSSQMQFERVKKAYTDYKKTVLANLEKHKINSESFDLFIRVYKAEDELQLWGKNNTEKQYVLLKKFEICAKSGELGPKRKMGDNQVPEGLYYIERYNPSSSYHLSLGINYPNASDKKISKASDLGGDIFIHGDCVTIGCMPLQDEGIKELYVYTIESNKDKKNKIPVYIFPCKMEGVTFENAIKNNLNNKDAINLWSSLKIMNGYFDKYKSLPSWELNEKSYYGLKK